MRTKFIFEIESLKDLIERLIERTNDKTLQWTFIDNGLSVPRYVYQTSFNSNRVAVLESSGKEYELWLSDGKHSDPIYVVIEVNDKIYPLVAALYKVAYNSHYEACKPILQSMIDYLNSL